VDDPGCTGAFYSAAFGLGPQASEGPATCFRGFTLNRWGDGVECGADEAVDGGGRKFVSFAAASGAIELVLYGRGGAATAAGVFPDGRGSRRIAIVSDAGTFTDRDGFVWEAPRSD